MSRLAELYGTWRTLSASKFVNICLMITSSKPAFPINNNTKNITERLELCDCRADPMVQFPHKRTINFDSSRSTMVWTNLRTYTVVRGPWQGQKDIIYDKFENCAIVCDDLIQSPWARFSCVLVSPWPANNMPAAWDIESVWCTLSWRTRQTESLSIDVTKLADFHKQALRDQPANNNQ